MRGILAVVVVLAAVDVRALPQLYRSDVECTTEYRVVNTIVNKEETRRVCNPVTK